jgi:hypothetical protein
VSTQVRRYVFLDPDGSQNFGLCVIILSPTGVEYAHQCGGLGCDLRKAEGFLIPLGDVSSSLIAFFDENWRGGTLGPESVWTDPQVRRLAELVGEVFCWKTIEHGNDERQPLILDNSRLTECLEAWVPVLTAYGPGILVFENSD